MEYWWNKKRRGEFVRRIGDNFLWRLVDPLPLRDCVVHYVLLHRIDCNGLDGKKYPWLYYNISNEHEEKLAGLGACPTLDQERAIAELLPNLLP